jgi:hypothetical protein
LVVAEGRPANRSLAFEKFAIVPLMAPRKDRKVTVTDENVPDELTWTGVNLSVAGSSNVFENGAIKFNVTETGQFVAPLISGSNSIAIVCKF